MPFSKVAKNNIMQELFTILYMISSVIKMNAIPTYMHTCIHTYIYRHTFMYKINTMI
jgi:hypothetical protein